MPEKTREFCVDDEAYYALLLLQRQRVKAFLEGSEYGNPFPEKTLANLHAAERGLAEEMTKAACRLGIGERNAEYLASD